MALRGTKSVAKFRLKVGYTRQTENSHVARALQRVQRRQREREAREAAAADSNMDVGSVGSEKAIEVDTIVIIYIS